MTGAASGIGKALVDECERRDMRVFTADVAGDPPLDVRDFVAVTEFADRVYEQTDCVDLVFNNAGVMLPAAIEERKLADWEQMIDLNVTGLMRVIYAFIPDLVAAAKAGKRADLINTSSIAGQYLYPTFAVYSATKAYVSHLSRHLRLELGPKHVRVSMLEPGIVATELQSHVTDQGALDWLDGAKKTIDWLQPDDVAEVVAFTAALPAHVNLQQVTVMPTRQGI